MGFQRLRLSAEFRARSGFAVALVLLIGVAGGASLGAAAGARRTASVVERLRSNSHIYDVNINPLEDVPAAKWGEVDRLSQVARTVHLVGRLGARLKPDGSLDIGWLSAVQVVVTDRTYMRDVDRPRVVAGRLPELPNDAVVNQRAADKLNLHVGDRVPVRFFDASRDVTDQPGVDGVMTVTGIVVTFDDALKDPEDSTLQPVIAYGPGASHPELAPPYDLRAYWLRHGAADVPSFVADARRIVGSHAFAAQDSGAATDRANRSLRPYVLALVVVALLFFATGFTVIAQAIARDERHRAHEYPTVRALGATDRQLIGLAMLRGSLVGVCGTVLAVLLAVLASPLTPLGDARSLEPHTGLRIDFAILGLGAALTLLLVASATVGAAWANLRRPNERRRRTLSVGRATSWHGASPVSTIGTSFALARPRGAGGTAPSRSFSGLILVLAVMASSVVVSMNLGRFTSSPERYGWRWDAIVSYVEDRESVATALAADPDVGDVVEGSHGLVVVGDRAVPAVGLGDGRPNSSVELAAGRSPIADNEVVLGLATSKALHAPIGATIEAATDNGVRSLTVVGNGIFPRFAPYEASEPTGLGVGAAMTMHGLSALGQAGFAQTFFLVARAPGHALNAATLRSRLFAKNPLGGEVFGRQRPVDVRGYAQMSKAPWLLTFVLGCLLLGALAHVLASGTRHRHRDLAVLRALGFTSQQVRRTIVVQLTVLVTIVAVVAVPTGVIAGRWAWRLSARRLGISDDVAVPVAHIGYVLAIVAAAGLLIAVIFGARAARRPVQTSLVSE